MLDLDSSDEHKYAELQLTGCVLFLAPFLVNSRDCENVRAEV